MNYKSLFIVYCLIKTFDVFANTAPVILISIDGFSHKYLDMYQPKNILNLSKTGVITKGLLPVFPSKTFPNHLSIVTGVYPQNHGIIHNKFFHPLLNEEYTKGAGKNNSSWLIATPIWALAEQQGIKTAIYFWPESETKILGKLPSFYFPYKNNTSNIKRINQIVDWLKMPSSTRPQFIASYISTVDTAGHIYGPDSIEVKQAIEDVDDLLGVLFARLKNEVDEDVNIILVSDHGMVTSGKEFEIPLNTIVSAKDNVKIINGETQLFIYTNDINTRKETHIELIHSMTKNAKGSYQVFQKGEYPLHWHFDSKLTAIPDLIVNAIPPYSFSNNAKKHSAIATHGYDPQNVRDLDGIFIANGPSFRKGISIGSFENIHIFPLLVNILALNNTENIDGNLNVLAPIINSVPLTIE